MVLEQKIEKKFYAQLGKIVLYNMVSVPLVYQEANSYIALGGALIGDAAHTIHPLAGQGINLGIRDVITLSELLINENIFDRNRNISENMLLSYKNNRQRDVFFMQASINCLYFIFNNNLLPLKITRNIAFMTVERLSFIKKKILQYAVLGEKSFKLLSIMMR